MITAIHRALLSLFGRLPRGLRRRVVRTIAPSYTVGAICVIERSDGQVALIQQRYRRRWGLPGGLLARREAPHHAARREVREEIGIDVELIGEPVVIVEPHAQRIDIVYLARPMDSHLGEVALVPRSAEIIGACWFPVDALPELQDETAAALQALGKTVSPQQ